MSDAHTSAYDEVVYPSAVYSQTHPDRLATIATLYGLTPAPVERCRVLELGCGDGVNLIAMAHGLPGSDFVGIDLAEHPIAKGNRIIGQLKLGNISLRQMDVVDALSELGQFDYIVAHGLYSWVPPQAREKIMEVCGRCLAENGVAYISYNAYPGHHSRDLVRGMMRYHTARLADPEAQIGQARALIGLLAESKGEPDVYHRLLSDELNRILQRRDATFFHDDLSAVNQPFYFQEFMAHARRHGLQFLGEADITDMQEEKWRHRLDAILGPQRNSDVIDREQYKDFFRGRAFRQTLLCHEDIALDRSIHPSRTHDLYVESDIQLASPEPSGLAGDHESFRRKRGTDGAVTLETDKPLLRAAFRHLGKTYPRYTHFADLLSAARLEANESSVSGPPDPETEIRELESALVQAYAAGFLDLHVHLPSFAPEAGPRPTASALARLMLETGNSAATLRHNTVDFKDDLSRQLVMLLDGTRDRKTLIEDLQRLVHESGAGISTDEQTAADAGELHRTISRNLDENLATVARLALLTA